MGGLWVDYNLMSTIPGLFVLGEANFSDHGANRLGASALMQGLADGYFVLPVHDRRLPRVDQARAGDDRRTPRFKAAEADGAASARSSCSASRASARSTSFHRELGKIMWENCGMARNAAGLTKALELIPQLREEFWENVNVPGSGAELNQTLENAGRVADFLELGELMCRDALHREESCGGHFRDGVPDAGRRGAAQRRALRLRRGVGVRGRRASRRCCNKEPLVFENVQAVAAELQVSGMR